MKLEDFFSRRAWKRWARQGFSSGHTKTQSSSAEQEQPAKATEIKLLMLFMVALLFCLCVMGWYLYTQ